jgi:hypothetical protein
MSTIKNWFENNKKTILFWVAAFLVLTLGFAAGYLIGRQTNPPPIIIENNS